MPSVSHQVDQVLEVDLTSLSELERKEIIECHENPDAYLCDDSFPGEMACRIEECLAKENSEKPGLFILKRTLYFDFSWEDEDAEWEEDNTTTDDANFPSYVVGDYEENVLVTPCMITKRTIVERLSNTIDQQTIGFE